MSKTVTELLADPLKGYTRAQGILCFFFRHALCQRRVNQFIWNKRMRLYFEKPHNRNNQDRGNLNKALTQSDFTWGTFKKAIDFLNPLSATLTVRLTWSSGLVSEHHIEIDPAEDESDPALNTFDPDQQSEVFDKKGMPASTLARLFRKIVNERGITNTQWDALLNEFARNPVNVSEQSRRNVTRAVGDLNRELLKPRMTWNVFRKGILMLNPRQTEYILTLRWSKEDKDVSVHAVCINDPLATHSPSQCDE